MGPPWGATGLLLGHLDGFGVFLGSYSDPRGTPLGTPKSTKSWAEGVPGVSWLPRGAQRCQKGPQKGPKGHPKDAKMAPKVTKICLSRVLLKARK